MRTLDNANIKYLYELSKINDNGRDPYEQFKQSLLEQGFSEIDACHETALYMNMICDMMD
ncbi:hypothetical protein D3C76_336130 [compost metagenome]